MNLNDNISKPLAFPSRITTISDLKDIYYDGEELSEEQRCALSNFDKMRVKTLSLAGTDKEFQSVYFNLQLKENVSDYKEFIS